MPRISTNDADLHYEEHGAGTPIVFCHEFAQNLDGWSGQVSHFSRCHRTIAYSRRGYPPSAIPKREDAYSFAQSVADLEQLVRDLDASPAHIVGHGAGGNIALALAIARPDMVRSLVLTGAGAGSGDPDEWKSSARAFAEEIEQGGMGALIRNIASAKQRTIFSDRDPAGWRAFIGSMGRLSARGCAHAMRGALSRPSFLELGDELATLRVPILLVIGDQDRPSFDGSHFVLEHAPRAAMAVIPLCGHTENLEHPSRFNDTVLTLVDAGRWINPDAGTSKIEDSSNRRSNEQNGGL
jgi:pimeloyl-ACP methyl ester carboxylesterase